MVRTVHHFAIFIRKFARAARRLVGEHVERGANAAFPDARA